MARSATLAGVICAAGEKRVPPGSPPGWGQEEGDCWARVNDGLATIPTSTTALRRHLDAFIRIPPSTGDRQRTACRGAAPTMDAVGRARKASWEERDGGGC